MDNLFTNEQGEPNFRSISTKEANDGFLAGQGSDGVPPFGQGGGREGSIESDESLVRFYSPKDGALSEGAWLARKSDAVGKTPEEIQKMYALPNRSERMIDVDARGMPARAGSVASNFGHSTSDTIQVQLLKRGAKFSGARLLHSGKVIS